MPGVLEMKGGALRVFGVFGILILFASAAFGQGGPPGRGPEFGGGRPMGPMLYPLERMAKELNLTEAQSAVIKDLRQGFLRDTLPWRDELVVKRMNLQDLLRGPQPDPERVLKKQREVSELESKIQERMVSHYLEIRKALTPEQIRLLPPAFGAPGFGGHRMRRGAGHTREGE
jgi:Spy/CpxP family protein refolding chaperone